jgi:hypothetical protein
MRSLLLAMTLAVLVPASASAAWKYNPPPSYTPSPSGGANISSPRGSIYVPGPRQKVCTTNRNGYRTCF